MTFWDAVLGLGTGPFLFLFFALFVAFAFEFINGFHDTANAVTTVIYTRSLQPTPAVIYSGFLNFLGVLLGGTAVAFGIVNLLPVDLLVDARSGAALVMVMSLLLAGVTWNLGTWYIGLPVSSSVHADRPDPRRRHRERVVEWACRRSWHECGQGRVGATHLAARRVRRVAASPLLLKPIFRNPKLHVPPEGDDGRR